MKYSKKSFLFFFVIALFILLKEYYSLSDKQSLRLPKPILTLDTGILDSYLKTYDDNRSLNWYWGFTKEKKVKVSDGNKTVKQLKSGPNIYQPKGENTLCIDNSCYRLVGIHYSKNRAFVTLYNKKLKKRLKDYSVKETLEANISIAAIRSNSVIFADQNKTKSWKFQLFDVNTTQYKPKDTNETYF